MDGLAGLLLWSRALGTLGLRVERGHGYGENQALRRQGHGRGECGGPLDARCLPILRESKERCLETIGSDPLEEQE